MIRRTFLALLGALPFAAIFSPEKPNTVTLTMPNLFPTPQPLQGFSVDDVSYASDNLLNEWAKWLGFVRQPAVLGTVEWDEWPRDILTGEPAEPDAVFKKRIADHILGR